ncbi:MAG: lipopolysaccharide core heptose(II) kinase RfaY [Cyclobacteriaceae bacterium]
MKSQCEIPVSKVQRASKFIKTGAKIGGNYIKHYSKKLVDPETTREELDQDNAEDIYDSLSELKGSALKVAQMLAMDKNMLPTAYQNKFALAQYSAPPLSYPLVVKTFRTYLSDSPENIFDSFTKSAVNAASIGQVHKATIGNKTYAVKVQYPGVANSISSDLKLVKPIAQRLFNLSKVDLDYYLSEVEQKLLEETDYALEVERSQSIANQCSQINNVYFAQYYPELSAERIITMDWLEGVHLDKFLQTNPSQEVKNTIGQALWDFYHHQVHNLKMVHADPHPGNFLMNTDGRLGIIDFGCVKEIPDKFYNNYFKLIHSTMLDQDELMSIFYKLNFLYPDDNKKEIDFYVPLFKETMNLLGQPFHTDHFDFGNDIYFEEIYKVGERLSKMEELRKSKHPRGAKDGIYINRTYFGLYQLLNMLKAKVDTSSFTPLKKAS